MATITLRKKKGSWEYRIYFGIIDGKAKRISMSGFVSKREAQRAAEQRIVEWKGQLQQCPIDNRTSYGAFLDFWLQNYCSANLKQTSTHDYRKRVQSVIKPRLGSYPINELTPMILQQFITELFNAGYSRNALSTIKGILSSSLRYAVLPAGILTVNPAMYVKLPLPRAKPRTKPREHKRSSITAEQWASIMQRFPVYHPSHVVLNLGYHLGLRLGQAFGLCWEDVDFDAKMISIKRQVQYDDEQKCWYFTEPKYDSVRTINMDPVLAKILLEECQRQEKAKVFFGSRYHQIYVDRENRFASEGTPVHLINTREDGTYIQPRTTQHINRVVQRELGIPDFDFHTLRHTHATMLIERGADLADVQERLGHTKVDMTARYVHDTDRQRSRTKKILDTIYSSDNATST